MTEEQVIQRLHLLRNIKPNLGWSSSVKAQILRPTLWQTLSTVLGISPQMKMAYVFSALLMAMVGTLGFIQYTAPGDDGVFIIGTISQAAVKESVQAFKQSPKNLVAAKNLAQAIQKNPAKAKDIALELKQNGTLAAIVDNSETKETSDIVYKPLLDQLIKDGEKTTFTLDGQQKFDQVKELHKQGEYAKGLELYFTISN